MTAADLARVRLLDQEVFGADRGPLLEFQLALQMSLTKYNTPFVRGRVMHMPVLMTCTPQAVHEVMVTRRARPGTRSDMLSPEAGSEHTVTQARARPPHRVRGGDDMADLLRGA